MKRVALAPLLLTLVFGHWAIAQVLSADPTGGARVVATEELKKFPARVSTVPSHSPFFVSDRSVLESATLDEPFVFYGPDTTFLAHYGDTDAEDRDLLRYFRKSVRFPVCAEGRVLGTISVQEDENGVWTKCGQTVGDRVVTAIAECRRSAAVAARQRISVLHTSFAGLYAIVEDGTHIISLMPMDKGTHKLVEDAISRSVEGPWISPELVLPIIQAKVRATRELELSPAGWTITQPLSADPTGGARVVAIEELNKLPARVSTAPSHSPFLVSDRSALESAKLGQPFVFYWPDSTFLPRYEKSEAGEILQYLRKSVCFPVYAGDRVLGTLNVQEGENGLWTAGAHTVGDKTVTSIAEYSRSASAAAGQRVSILNTAFAGQFAVVEDGMHILAFMPLDTGTRKLVEDAILPNASGSSWIPPERVFPIIQAEVHAARERELRSPSDDR